MVLAAEPIAPKMGIVPVVIGATEAHAPTRPLREEAAIAIMIVSPGIVLMVSAVKIVVLTAAKPATIATPATPTAFVATFVQEETPTTLVPTMAPAAAIGMALVTVLEAAGSMHRAPFVNTQGAMATVTAPLGIATDLEPATPKTAMHAGTI